MKDIKPTFSKSALRWGITALILLIFSMGSFYLNKSSDGIVSTFSVLFPILIAIIFNLAGFVYLIKGIQEKIVELVGEINSLMGGLN